MYKIKNNIIAASCIANILLFAIISLGISLAILPLYINKILGYSALYVGLVVAAESLSTLLSRSFSGRFSDNYGPRKGMILGLFLIIFAGFLCYLSFMFFKPGILAFSIIIFSRIPMGIGESLIFTCSGTWPIGLVGREHAGKIMSWFGIAMFLGLAIGNYIGTWSYYQSGIIFSSIVMTLLPALGYIIIFIVNPVEVHPEKNQTTIFFTIKKIWKAGLGFSLASIGYATITTFLVLYFIQNDWSKQAAVALSAFGVGYVISRLTLGWKADNSGLKMTLFSLLIEAIGLLLIGLSSHPYEAMLGSFLTGFGLSMVYPLLALPALKSMPDKNIGLALSTYESCFDIGILFAGFIGGTIVSSFGYSAVFIFASCCCIIAIYCSVLAYIPARVARKDLIHKRSRKRV
ncbi:MFS transporter [Photorhabdus hindustanensis]|uniref:MFS transporter n=1 Tax=Photorhabdus hindustanensis TaxID=2918802 RepID=A0A2S8Q834_9GAMM|nr:MFS transporter [Photorhabdus hindustanensis]PQQ29121.1 MFS transporter [Photorhabdus hindustanensis]